MWVWNRYGTAYRAMYTLYEVTFVTFVSGLRNLMPFVMPFVSDSVALWMFPWSLHDSTSSAHDVMPGRELARKCPAGLRESQPCLYIWFSTSSTSPSLCHCLSCSRVGTTNGHGNDWERHTVIDVAAWGSGRSLAFCKTISFVLSGGHSIWDQASGFKDHKIGQCVAGAVGFWNRFLVKAISKSWVEIVGAILFDDDIWCLKLARNFHW